MTRFHVTITTYNRPAMCTRLIDALFGEIEAYRKETGIRARLDVVVFDDGSSLPIEIAHEYKGESIAWRYGDGTVRFIRCEHHGKRRYWELCRTAYASALRAGTRQTLYLQLPDDVLPVPGFFLTAERRYRALPSNRLCLNLLADKGRVGVRQWVPIKPSLVNTPAGWVWHTGWVDLCFIAEHRFIKMLSRLPWDYTVYSKKRQSSGVGAFISRMLCRRGGLYQLTHTLIEHGDHPSVMHPHHRKDNPLIT